MAQSGAEQTIRSETVFEGKVIRVCHDCVRLPNGADAMREIVHHHGGVAVAALEGDAIYLVSQYRYAYGAQMLEIPAGKLEAGEMPNQCAARELEEEVGLSPVKLTNLGVLYPTVGYCDEVIYLYMADNFRKVSQHLDEDEFLEVVKVPFEKALAMVMSGEIKDSKTQIAILKIALMRGER